MTNQITSKLDVYGAEKRFALYADCRLAKALVDVSMTWALIYELWQPLVSNGICAARPAPVCLWIHVYCVCIGHVCA